LPKKIIARGVGSYRPKLQKKIQRILTNAAEHRHIPQKLKPQSVYDI